MAVVISKNSALNDDFWKPVGQLIEAVIDDANVVNSRDKELVSKLFVEKKSNKYAEKITGLTSLGAFDVVAEGEKAKLDDIQEAFPKMIVHKTFAKSIAITQEMIEDGDIDVAAKVRNNLVKAYDRTRAQLASACLTGATSATVTYGGETFDTTTGDGQPLFSASHVMKKASGTQSNLKTSKELTLANLIEVANDGRNFKNESGDVCGLLFDTIIVPGNRPLTETVAKQIIGSDKTPADDKNSINTEKGQWKLVVDPYWIAEAGHEPYIIMSSEANDELLGNLFYDRKVLDVQTDVDVDSRNLTINGRARMSCGFGNWRHAIYCDKAASI